MNVTIPRSMLEWFVAYVDQNNTMVANTHLNPRTREIEPGSVRREVLAGMIVDKMVGAHQACVQKNVDEVLANG